jgi:hypothetical protein
MIWKFMERGLAYGLILMILLRQRDHHQTPIDVIFQNLEKENVSLCWMSAYARENEIISKASEKCFKIAVDDGIKMKTFETHRFLAVSSRKPTDGGSYDINYFVMDPEIKQYNISFRHTESPQINSNISFSYLWNYYFLRYRHQVMIGLTLLLISLDFFPSPSLPKDALQTIKSPRQLAVPRQGLKAFATLTMLLNHASYLLLKDSPSWMRLGALPADMAGSMHLFCWLTGYNYSPYSRSQSWTILVLFLILEQYCRLPSPFAYESLMTIVFARKLLSFSPFQSFLLRASLLFHSIFIVFLLSTESFLNADGLRILQISGLIYAIAGRTFVLPVDIWKQLLWLFAGSFKVLLIVWTVTLSEIDTSSIPQLTVAALCLLWFIFHLFLFGCPVKKPFWKYSPNFMITFLSRYSLEIYGAHLFLAYYYHLQSTTSS